MSRRIGVVCFVRIFWNRFFLCVCVFFFLLASTCQVNTILWVRSVLPLLADAAEKTGLPKDCFELRQISREQGGYSG